ncbi:MAG: transcription elongation factor GreA [Eubacteriales bacterium]|nr:transcription elongation factor GreA [Eubacteriales bacterium]
MPKSEQLTPEDVRRIEAEIEHRKTVVRPASLKALKEARAMGDLSENFEYYAAKRDNNMNNSRIRYLEKLLRFATVIDDSSASDEVGVNNTVKVHFDTDPEDVFMEYRIVTSIRSDSRRGLISTESPLGKSLMGHKVGDRVSYTVEGGATFSLTIIELHNTGEALNDKIHQY